MKWRLRIPIILAAAVMIAAAVVQVRHYLIFGHIVPLGLHADVTVKKADLGIPGITKVYEAYVTNFGVFPRRVRRCEYLTDAMARGVGIGYRVQQLNQSSGRWQTVVDAASDFCQPYPLGISEAHLTSKLLWPGQTLPSASEATGARGNLKGETTRFLVVVNDRDLPTAPFTIDEQIQGVDVGYRVSH